MKFRSAGRAMDTDRHDQSPLRLDPAHLENGRGGGCGLLAPQFSADSDGASGAIGIVLALAVWFSRLGLKARKAVPFCKVIDFPAGHSRSHPHVFILSLPRNDCKLGLSSPCFRPLVVECGAFGTIRIPPE